MLFHWYSGGDASVHPLLVAMLALAVDAAVGDPPKFYRRVPHPVVLFGRLAGFCEARFNRGRARLLRGAATSLSLTALAAAFGYALQAALAEHRFGWVVGAVLASTLIAYRGLFDHVREVAEGLDRSLDAGRSAVAHIVGRDPESLDEHGVARAAIESAAENFSDGVAAPILWFAIFGLPGLCACKAINTLDSMIGHRDARHERFGKFAARLDDAVNAIPARIAALLIAAVAGKGTRGAWIATTRDARRHRSANAGWPEAAMAGALGLALAGPRRYRGETVDDAWMNGEGRTEAGPEDIRRALRLYRRAAGALAASLLAIMALA